jgi:hypothetical protein
MKTMLLVFASLAPVWSVPSVVAAQDQDTATIEAYISRQAHQQHGEEDPDARKIVTGDLDRDGSPETVVLYTIEGQGGSNNYIQYVAVFARHNGKLEPVAYTSVGGKSRRSVELAGVEDNSIRLETMAYGPKDAACCPSVKGETRYVLAGRTLREQKGHPSAAKHS